MIEGFDTSLPGVFFIYASWLRYAMLIPGCVCILEDGNGGSGKQSALHMRSIDGSIAPWTQMGQYVHFHF